MGGDIITERSRVTAQHLTIAEAARLFADHAHRIAVIAHVNPDADAIGSGLAIVHIARLLEKEAWLSFAWPDRTPETLRILPGADDIVRPGEIPEDLDFVVVVDCGSADRMGELHHLAEKVPYTLILDHHRSNDGFGTHSVIIPRADATAQLVLDFLDALGLELTEDISQCLFAGLLTDTGGFHWGSPRAHSDAARLVQTGIDSDTLTRQLMDTRPFSYLELLATVLQTATLIRDAGKGRGLVYATVSYDVYRHARPEDVQALIDVVRTTAEAEVALVVREMTPGTWTGSLRSRSLVNVAEIARHLGGGGHRRAAGFTVQSSLPEVLDQILTMLNDPPLHDGFRALN